MNFPLGQISRCWLFHIAPYPKHDVLLSMKTNQACKSSFYSRRLAVLVLLITAPFADALMNSACLQG